MEKYIGKRKGADKVSAKEFDAGYKEFKIGVMQRNYCRFEQSSIAAVKSKVQRLTVILFLLLVPFTRATAGVFFSASKNVAHANCRQAGLAAVIGHQPHDVVRDSYRSNHALRHSARRNRTLSGSDESFIPGLCDKVLLADCRAASRLFSVIESPADLLRCWRFNLRVASEPRAPSSFC